MIQYEKELNQEQLQVVRTGDGPCLVLAGAGTGKTRAIVYRVAYLLGRGVDPGRILLVTFTNKAAREMLRRVELLNGAPPQGLWGGTFHHVGHALLRRYGVRIGIPPTFTILDAEDNVALLKSVMVESGHGKKDDKYFPSPDVMENLISFAANSLRPLPDLIQEWIPRHAHLTPELLRIATVYEQKKRERNVVSFDDLLAFWLRILRERPEVRDSLGGKFEYVLIDEYQDTNRLQGCIVEALASEHKNVLVVGDDAQSIYAFRAATVENIMRFPEVFPGARTFRLEQNYRSTQAILDLANASILSNRRQFEKSLHAVHGRGTRPELVGCADPLAEARFVADTISELRENGDTLLQSAVLFRAAFHGMQLELELQKRRMPYIIRGGIRFFEQAHIKDVVAYLRVMSNPQDELAWQRVLRMEEGIGAKTAEEIIGAFKNLQAKTLSSAAQRAWERVRGRVEKLKTVSGVSEMINYALTAFYETYAEVKFENAGERLEDLEQLAVFAKSYETLEQFLADATLSEGFRGERGAIGEGLASDGSEARPPEYLVLSTIHQAKGLEWKNVFLIGLVDGQFPHYKSLARRDEREEERRLFYVAITRAQERLFLTYPLLGAGSYGSASREASLFVREVDPRLYHLRTEDEEVIEI